MELVDNDGYLRYVGFLSMYLLSAGERIDLGGCDFNENDGAASYL